MSRSSASTSNTSPGPPFSTSPLSPGNPPPSTISTAKRQTVSSSLLNTFLSHIQYCRTISLSLLILIKAYRRQIRCNFNACFQNPNEHIFSSRLASVGRRARFDVRFHVAFPHLPNSASARLFVELFSHRRHQHSTRRAIRGAARRQVPPPEDYRQRQLCQSQTRAACTHRRRGRHQNH